MNRFAQYLIRIQPSIKACCLNSISNVQKLPTCSNVIPSCSTTTCFFSQIKGPMNFEEIDEKKEAEMKKKIEQISNYYDQYIEEYYEMDEKKDVDVEEVEDEIVQETTKFHLKSITLEEIHELLDEFRAQDIVVLKLPENQAMHNHMFICSPFNARHSDALTEKLRKYLKSNFHMNQKDMEDIQKRKQAAGWYILDLPNFIIHIMTPEAREKYDLETLWGIGEDEDDHPTVQPTLDGIEDHQKLPPLKDKPKFLAERIRGK